MADIFAKSFSLQVYSGISPFGNLVTRRLSENLQHKAEDASEEFHQYSGQYVLDQYCLIQK